MTLPMIDEGSYPDWPGARRRNCSAPHSHRNPGDNDTWYLHRATSSLGLLIKSNGAEECRIACTVCRTSVVVLTHRAARHLIRRGWTVDWVHDNSHTE